MALRADLLAVSRAERPTLKGIALAKLPRRSATRVSGDVEIQSISAIPRGVELMVRAWHPDGRARGFGDGTVEIERIRILNPPIMVPDPTGPLDLSFFDDEGVLHRRLFREDLDEALLQAWDHIVRVAPTHGPGRIVPGKVGRTVSTFYAGGGDGHIEATNAVWATCHALTDANIAADATTNPFRVNTGIFSTNFDIRRAFIPIYTGDLPDTDNITDATLSLYVSALSGNGDNDGDDWFVPVGPTTQADPTTLALADFDTCGAVTSPTEFSNDRKDYSAHTVSTYADWAFNASGLANISKTGFTLIGLREGHDVLNSAYAGANDTSNQIRYASSEDGGAGTANDPVIVVTHTAGPRFILGTH